MSRLGLITFVAAVGLSVTAANAACSGAAGGGTGGGVRTGTVGHVSGGVSHAHAGGAVSTGCHVTTNTTAGAAKAALMPASHIAMVPEHRAVKAAGAGRTTLPHTAIAHTAIRRPHHT